MYSGVQRTDSSLCEVVWDKPPAAEYGQNKWAGEVVDFGRNRSQSSPVYIGGIDVEIVTFYKYLGVLKILKSRILKIKNYNNLT